MPGSTRTDWEWHELPSELLHLRKTLLHLLCSVENHYIYFENQAALVSSHRHPVFAFFLFQKKAKKENPRSAKRL